MQEDELHYLRLRSQRFYDAMDDASTLIHHLCAIQAQELHSALLAVRPRSIGLTTADVEHALLEDRSIIRTWAMRGTLHLLAADDLAWLLPLLGPEEIRKSQRRLRQLDLTDEVWRRALPAIRGILRGSPPLTRREIAAELDNSGIPTEGQRIYHLLRRAGLEGVLCYGPQQGRDPTYTLLEEWTGIELVPPTDNSHVELARRYLRAYAPAAPEDFAAWAGLSIRAARAAFEELASDLIELDADGDARWLLKSQEAWLDASPANRPVVTLLPAYDTYLLGYRSRDFMVDEAHARQVHPGGGVIRPTMLVNGLAAGIWTLEKSRAGRIVTVSAFDTLDDGLEEALDAEVQDLGRFLMQPISWRMTA